MYSKQTGDWVEKKKQDFLDWVTIGNGRNVISRLILVSVLIYVLIDASAFSSPNFWYLSIVLVIFAGILSGEALDDFSKLVIKLFLVLLSIVITNAWINKTKLFGTYEVTDNIMLVLVTSVYVYYTYRIIESNKQLFEKARLPILVFHLGNNLDLKIQNASQDFIARKPKVTLRLYYPRLTSFKILKIIKWFSERANKKIQKDCQTLLPKSNDPTQYSKPKEYSQTIPLSENLKEVLALSPNFCGQIDFWITLTCSYTTDQVEGERSVIEKWHVYLKVDNGNLSIPPEYQLSY